MEQEAQVLNENSADAANDIRLVAEILRKDRKATAEFVERFADCVYSYVRRRVMPQAEAVEDLVQEVFLAAWNSLGSFRGEASLRHWLLGIARHKIEDYYRKRLREPEVPEEIDEELPELVVIPKYEDELDRAANLEKTYRVLAKLPENYGLVLLWRYLEQRSASEMARLTGRTEKAIERLLARARDHFRKEWNNVSS
jgi:RNA polymerase sigma-70 factor, ECF subfamily